MALSKLTKDMAIIQKLDDEPNDVGGLTAAELKAKFDEAGEAVKEFLNETLLPELGGDHAAGSLGAVLNGEKMSVQEALDLLQMASIQSGNVPVGGGAGDLLQKKSGALYDLEWRPVFTGVAFSQEDWADLEGTGWSRVEGRSWNDLPAAANGRQMKQIQELVGAAAAMCTPLQMRYLHAYYAEELTLEEIGARFGVDRSTVSRVLKRGRQRIERYVTARLLLGRCVDGRGLFDYQLFLNSARVLTERQKELVYLMLARDTSYRDIAGYIGRYPSTVSHTVDRVEERLGGLAVAVDPGLSAVRVRRADWEGRSEKELAEALGLSPAFYYRVVRRGEKADGLPLLYCAILHRLRRGESVERTARELGCSQTLVKRVRRDHGGQPLPAFREDYRPKQPRRIRPPGNPFAALGGGDAVIDRIDADTYRALQERFGGSNCAGT